MATRLLFGAKVSWSHLGASEQRSLFGEFLRVKP
jgi:hypothetical protein